MAAVDWDITWCVVVVNSDQNNDVNLSAAPHLLLQDALLIYLHPSSLNAVIRQKGAKSNVRRNLSDKSEV